MKLRFSLAALLVVLFSLGLSNTTVFASMQTGFSGQVQVTPPPFPHVVSPPAEASAEELEHKGDLLRAEKGMLDALDYYRAAFLKSPKNAALLNKIGIVHLQLSRYPEAKKNFEAAIRLDHRYSDARNNLGVICYLNRDYGRAIKEYRKAIGLREDSASFYSNLGAAYFAKKDFPKAITAYAKALELDPDVFEHSSRVGVTAQMPSPGDRAQYYYILARMFAKSGATDRSLNYLRRAMEDGYKDINKVFRDEEFTAVRKDPRFLALMNNKPVAIPD